MTKEWDVCVITAGAIPTGTFAIRCTDPETLRLFEEQFAASRFGKRGRRQREIRGNSYSRAVDRLSTAKGESEECLWWLLGMLCKGGWEPFEHHFGVPTEVCLRRERLASAPERLL